MYIESLKLKRFRNYPNQMFELKNGMNLILGDNGIGKTNLLESIYLLSTTRSHRNDDERFYSFLTFYSLEDLINQGKRYLKRSNNIPMQVLNYLTPIEMRNKLLNS